MAANKGSKGEEVVDVDKQNTVQAAGGTETAPADGITRASNDKAAFAAATSTPSEAPAATPRPQSHRRYSVLLMFAHLFDDLNQGALIAVIPFLVLGGYSYAQATALLLVSNAASAVIQPLFGWLGDKFQKPWFMALGIFVAGLGMVGVGLLPSYPLILASAMFSGVGIAMFHPEAGRLANLVAGEKKGHGMSIFAVGGKLGFTIGPLVTAAALGAFGLSGCVVFIVPATLAAVVLLACNRAFVQLGSAEQAVVDASGVQDNWRGFSIVMGAIGVRSIIYFALLSFIPLFLVANLGQEESFASSVISLFAIVCAVATLLSGPAGQWLGTKRLIMASYTCVAVLVVVFAFNTSLVVALVLTMCLALTEDISYPSAVATGQGFLPHHLGMASGISFGLMVCVGGIASPVLGAVGDVCGLQVVMLLLAVIALVGVGIAAFIPGQKSR